MRNYYVAIIVIAVVAVAAVIWQSLASGPVKADQALVLRIQTAQANISDYNSRNHRLPAGLSELEGDHTGVTYETLNDHTFKLCGNFLTASRNQNQTRPDHFETSYIDATQHGKGNQCFVGTVSP